MTRMNAASLKAHRKIGNGLLVLRRVIGLFVGFFFCLSVFVAYKFQVSVNSPQENASHSLPIARGLPPTPSESGMTYRDWRKLAVHLAVMTPDQALMQLDKSDPFGTRTFERKLKESETEKQRSLSIEEVRELFPCPADRLTLPDQRDYAKAEAFRNGGDTFLLFQHLRKAGGTNFCTLAQHNLPSSAISEYFCMSDMYWHPKRRCAGCLSHWSNHEIESKLKNDGHRIQGNEWDNFEERFFNLSAALATSFRKPLDRMLSQYRFECVEDRGCKGWDLDRFRTKRKDLFNVYTRTFSNAPIGPDLIGIYLGNSTEDGENRGKLIGRSLDNVAKFHLVMVMEWLAYSHDEVRSILGFKDTSILTQRVRPHIGQARRNDGQEINKLGAAGIAKASWDPKDKLTSIQFKEMSERLAMDEILNDAARRMFLERLVCPDVQLSMKIES